MGSWSSLLSKIKQEFRLIMKTVYRDARDDEDEAGKGSSDM